ncbi:MAG: hypothetical protein WCA22_07490 [Candidatus Binatus sp.]
MKTTLEYRDDFLYVVEEKDGTTGAPPKWLPVRKADYAEAQTLHGRPVTSVNLQEGIYVDEEGNGFQLADKGETKPIAVEHLPGREKTELEVLLEASLKGGKEHEPNADSRGAHREMRNNGRSAVTVVHPTEYHLPAGFGFLLGRFQYGDLQRGQTRGSLPVSRGNHLCPHRSQRKPHSLTLATFSPPPIFVAPYSF